MALLIYITVLMMLPPLVMQASTELERTVTHLITSSEYIRPGEAFKVDVNILSGIESVTVSASVVIYNTRSNEVEETIASGMDDFNIGDSGIIEMAVPESLVALTYPQEYHLQLEVTGGLEFTSNKELTLLTKTKSIFVQTDKGTYKPGDKVQFRVFATDSSLLVMTGPFDIKILDSASNGIAQWLDQSPPGGLFTGELQLSDYVNLGDWTIRVTYGDYVEEKIFKVDEYVLPRFEVTVNLPSYVITLPGRELPITVKAMYTYGQPVQGSADIVIKKQWSTQTLLFRNRQLEADGTYSMTVDLEDLCFDRYCTVNNLAYDTVTVEANVTETATGTTLSGHGTPNLSQYSLNVKFMDATPSSFKTGFPFVAFVQVTQPDGRPPDVSVADLPVTLSGYLVCTSGNSDCEQQQLPEETMDAPMSGILPFALDLSDIEPLYQSMELQVTLTDPVTQQLISSHHSVSAFMSEGNEAVQVTQRTSSDDVGSTIYANMMVFFDVQTTAEVSDVYYQVYSKGHLLMADTIHSSPATRDHEFSLDVTEDLARKMSPSARIIVSYITSSGELVADTLQIQVDGALTNPVSVSFTAEEVSPYETAAVEGTAAPNSFVGLLAVDKSVQLLRTGNDITQADVMAELQSYDTADSNSGGGGCIWWRRRRKRDIWPCFPFSSGTDATSLYQNNHVLVFTDASLYESVPDDVWIHGPVGMPGPPGAPGAPGVEFFPAVAESAPVGPAGPAGPAGPNEGDENDVISRVPDLMEVTQVRDIFQETWIFSDITAGADGSFQTEEMDVPDTITSWVLSAFAIHDTAGLGIAQETQLNVFMPFFVTLSLPYSVIRGEKFALKATVFNYLNTAQDVTVTVPSSSDYAVMYDSEYDNVEVQQVLSDIQPNTAQTAIIWVLPSKLGSIDIEVRAQSPQASDALRRPLLVKPEGEPQEFSQSVLIILDNSDTLAHTFSVNFPANAIEDTKRLYITAVGNILGSTMTNLDQLLQMPSGCGEQNMLNFAPDVFITQYLTATDQTNSEIMTRALSYMNAGYQRELTYKRDDDSYSAFGNSDPEGSTWLTAFVVKTFNQAKQFLTLIDASVLVPSLEWLLEQQNDDGGFNSVGRVIHQELGVSDGLSLSAYCTIALLECRDLVDSTEEDLSGKIDLAVAHLESRLTGLQGDLYGLAITTYALALADSSMKAEAMSMLNAQAIEEGGLKYWRETSVESTPSPYDYWHPTPSTTEIEITAYGLLATLLNDNGINNAIPISKWLTSQQNKFGGFRSTQDTVMGLQALTQFVIATSTGSSATGLEISVYATRDDMLVEEQQFGSITDDNKDILMSIELPAMDTHSVAVVATGVGTAVVQMVGEYNIPEQDYESNVTLQVSIGNVDNNHVTLVNCIGWKGDMESGMAVMNVQSLSGFANDQSGLIDQYGDQGLKMVEVQENNLVLYFDEITEEEICITTVQARQFSVVGLQQSMVQGYAYYAPETINTVMYLPDVLATDDICAACAECDGCEDWSGGSGSQLANPFLILLSVIIIALRHVL